MSYYSVADAKNRLSELIDRAIAGDPVVITRHGHPVVTLRAVSSTVAPMAEKDFEWLAKRRVSLGVSVDAGTFVSQMRDEEER